MREFVAAARGDTRTILLDGWHLLHDAVAAAIDIKAVAVSVPPRVPADAALVDRLAGRVRVVTVSAPVMRAMSPVRTPSGVAALAARPEVHFDALLVPPPPLVVVPIHLQDPGNAGALIRAAEAGGATGVLLGGASADPWGWKALRAAMGSTFRLPVVREPDVQKVCEALRGAGLRLIAAVPRDGAPPDTLDLRGPTALLLGGEGGGLEADVVAAADERVSLPMRAPVESLNVAVAGALLVYEARRQRTAQARDTDH